MIAALLLAATVVNPIPVDLAKRVFAEARLASEEDGGKLWGLPLYGPMVFADPKTRMFIRANGTGGELPAGVIVANTAIKLDDHLTTMISWPCCSLSEISVAARQLASLRVGITIETLIRHSKPPASVVGFVGASRFRWCRSAEW